MQRRCSPGALLAVVLLVSCGPTSTPPTGRAGSGGTLRIVATTGMVADLATRLGGDRVAVEALMGPGVDPHLFKASAGDVGRLAEADLILYSGLHLEAAMGEVLEEMGERRRTAAVTAGLDRSRLLAPPEFAGAWDPHVWFDVSLWAETIDATTQALVAADPEGEASYRANARAYRQELEELHLWVEGRVSALPEERRVLITAHDAFNYFGRAYGFEVRGLQGISTAAEAGAADVRGLVDFAVERGIPAVFVETSIPRRTLEAVQAGAEARGFALAIGGSLYSDAMGNPGTPEGTYPGMVRHNVETIVSALAVGLEEAGP